MIKLSLCWSLRGERHSRRVSARSSGNSTALGLHLVVDSMQHIPVCAKLAKSSQCATCSLRPGQSSDMHLKSCVNLR